MPHAPADGLLQMPLAQHPAQFVELQVVPVVWQVPFTHACPEAQAVHTLPPPPHAVVVVPGTHIVEVAQHPPHVVESHAPPGT